MKKDHHDIGKYDSFADKYAAEVDQRPFHIYYERPGTWSLLPKQLKGLNVLDIGCGSGWYAEQLIKAGCQVTAMDLNAHMVEVTQKRLQGSGKVIQADLQKPLDFFPSESFDIVIAPLVIHYYGPLAMGECGCSAFSLYTGRLCGIIIRSRFFSGTNAGTITARRIKRRTPTLSVDNYQTLVSFRPRIKKMRLQVCLHRNMHDAAIVVR